ncbi:DUF1187 family protein [Xenorhabdus sp. Flor]|uniref:DUF1187 family protein n=1 Tax=Xenorhabdus cabanillasii TaxID=351673 RepID=UPI0019BA8EB2|nr:DUF1187 family protein [Xenorhabdus sp. Flor]
MKYIISATITKSGGMPVTWTHRSDKKMSKSECLKLVTPRHKKGITIPGEMRVALSHFSCRRVEA